MPYTVLSHTADTGIEATADSFPELVAELAEGMFALMAQVDLPVNGGRVQFEVVGAALDDLVVDTLAELLYRFEVDDVVFVEIGSRETAGGVSIVAKAVPLADTDVTGPPIKAVTYHDLAVEERSDGWFGRVYFDV